MGLSVVNKLVATDFFKLHHITDQMLVTLMRRSIFWHSLLGSLHFPNKYYPGCTRPCMARDREVTEMRDCKNNGNRYCTVMEMRDTQRNEREYCAELLFLKQSSCWCSLKESVAFYSLICISFSLNQ